VGLDAGTLLAHQQGDDLERGATRRPEGAALRTRLDLAHGAREHREDALVVEVAGTPLVAWCGAGGAGLALASSSQELLLWVPAGEWAWRDADIRTQSRS